jgi:hypothetical protein
MKALITVILALASFGASVEDPAEVARSEPFDILTHHRSYSTDPQSLNISGAHTVHLRRLTSIGQQVFLQNGSKLTMTLDENKFLRDQDDYIGVITQSDGSLRFSLPSEVEDDDIVTGWTSKPRSNARLGPPPGCGVFACLNTTANAHQMFCLTTIPPPSQSCTGVAMQVIPQLKSLLIVAYQWSGSYNLACIRVNVHYTVNGHLTLYYICCLYCSC